MSTSEAERSYRRRLLASAMPNDVSPQTLQKSISVLEDEFGSVAELKYSTLVKRLQENLDRAELNVSQLLGRIISLKKKSPDELGPDPGIQNFSPSASAPSQTTSRMSNLEGRLKVFNTLFGFIAANAQQRGSLDSLQKHFAVQVDSIGVAEPCLSSLRGWASGNGASIEGSNQDLHKVINEGFVWLCQSIGPVDADKVLLSAVRATEGLPEAFECPPRTFL